MIKEVEDREAARHLDSACGDSATVREVQRTRGLFTRSQRNRGRSSVNISNRAILFGAMGDHRDAGARDEKLPFTEAVVSQAILEMPDGARLAVSTCLDLWRDQKFGTDEFVSFLKCYAEQSATLAKVFQVDMDMLSSHHNDSTGGAGSVFSRRAGSSRGSGEKSNHKPHQDCEGSTLTASGGGGHSSKRYLNRTMMSKDSDEGSIERAEGSTSPDADRNISPSPHNAHGSLPQATSSDSEKGFDKGYMGSASESTGHSSRSRGADSNGCASSQGHSSMESGSGSCEGSGEQSGGSSDSGDKGNSPTYNSPNEEDAHDNTIALNLLDAIEGTGTTSRARKRQASSCFSQSSSKAAKVKAVIDPDAHASTASKGAIRTGPSPRSISGREHTYSPHTHAHSSKRSRHSNAGVASASCVSSGWCGGGQPRGPRGGSSSSKGMLAETATTESCDDSVTTNTHCHQPDGAAGSSGSGNCGEGRHDLGRTRTAATHYGMSILCAWVRELRGRWTKERRAHAVVGQGVFGRGQ